MSNFKNTIEQLQYSIDVLKEYVCDLEQNDDVNEMFALGKISAAFEEVRIHYNCLYDDVFAQEIKTKEKTDNTVYNFTDTISSIGAADFWSKTNSFLNMDRDYLKISSELEDKNK